MHNKMLFRRLWPTVTPAFKIFLKATAYWIICIFLLRGILTGLIINYNVRQEFGNLIEIDPFFWLYFFDAVIYVLFGIGIFIIFRHRPLIISIVVWVIELFHFITLVGFPGISSVPLGEFGNFLFFYAFVPAHIVFGTYGAAKLRGFIKSRGKVDIE